MLTRLRYLLLLLAMVLAGCSSLTLGYNQLPRLLGWWIDGYFDLDRAQRRELDAGLALLQDWHRREELPQWQAILQQAERSLAGGVSEAELMGLEAQLNASLQRTLARTAPVAGPWLASLRPAQWQHLRERRRERLQEWRDEQADDEDGSERAEGLVTALERWLGRLERPLVRRAEALVPHWPTIDAALWQEREARQQLAEQGLRAWAAGDGSGGVQLLMRAGARDLGSLGPATMALRQKAVGDVLKLLAEASPAQWQRARQRWSAWQEDLRELQEPG
jgi:hypothetical protein